MRLQSSVIVRASKGHFYVVLVRSFRSGIALEDLRAIFRNLRQKKKRNPITQFGKGPDALTEAALLKGYIAQKTRKYDR